VNPRRLRVSGALRLAVGDARVFEFERGGEQLEGFVLRHSKGLFAYVNRCPHWMVDLDLGDGRFYAAEIDRIYCKNHGALFRVEDGVCDLGPCFGQALEPLSLEVEGDDAWIDLGRAP
jgi:nitrite reductase/ring-hydroxylating ferredoxin subunit